MDGGGHMPGAVDRGCRLNGASVVIMTAPPGYTISAPSWGIVNGMLAVAPARSAGAIGLQLASANPSRGETRFALTLPSDGITRIAGY